MSKVIAAVQNFVRDEEGLTTVEYAIAGALVAAAVVVAFQNLGLAVSGRIDGLTAVVNTGAAGGGGTGGGGTGGGGTGGGSAPAP